jgi:hypothetical protein
LFSSPPAANAAGGFFIILLCYRIWLWVEFAKQLAQSFMARYKLERELFQSIAMPMLALRPW